MCALLIALGIQSYQSADRLYASIGGDHSLLVVSQKGRLAAVAFRCPGTPIYWQWESERYPTDDERYHPLGALQNYDTGFEWICRPIAIEHIPSKKRIELAQLPNELIVVGPMVPMWFVVLSTATLAAVPWLRWQFSLRSLLIAMTIAAIGFSVLITYRNVHCEKNVSAELAY